MSHMIVLYVNINVSTTKTDDNTVKIVPIGIILAIGDMYFPISENELAISDSKETSGNNLNGAVTAYRRK